MKENPKTKGVVHCFTGTETQLNKYLTLGMYIGITGWVTDTKRGLNLFSIIKNIPLDKLMIETDCPFLTPHNIDKNIKFNEPQYLKYIAEKISGAYNISLYDISYITTKNAKLFFNLN